MNLTGKIALVTGAGRGIGRGIAQVFAEHGADVAVNDIEITPDGASSVVDWIRSKGRRAIAVQADVSDRLAVESMFEQVRSEFGHIDILVNNAGIETIVPLVEMTDQQWERVTNVNLRGPWLCSQVFCRRVISDGRKGNIVNIGSIQSAKILPGERTTLPPSLPLRLLRETHPPK
jgi:NAD(P)-dependent dehydrogenase (short-subunit alcohol dehydrogenase family)